MSTKGKILVIRGGAIGDFILTLPVLAALRQQFPETGLEVLGYSHIAGLALAGGLADAVRSIEARPVAGFFARGGELDESLQRYFGQFSVIISYLYDPDQVFQENVARCSKAQYIAGPHRPNESASIHATEVYLQPLERLAIFAPDPVPRLRLPPLTLVKEEKIILPLAVHPGSGSERKNWPEEKWNDLLLRLIARSAVNLLLVGGEAEQDRLERLAACLPPARFALARHLPLPDLAVQLAACRAFVGHDSGISHLAAAIGLPAVVLWGNTMADIWRPRGEHISLLRHPSGLSALPVEHVLDKLQPLLA